MIIDAHTHLGEPPFKRPNWDIKFVDGTDLPIDFGADTKLPLDHLIKDMDQLNIDKSLVMGFEGWISNENLADVIKAYPDRIIGFGYVHNPKLY